MQLRQCVVVYSVVPHAMDLARKAHRLPVVLNVGTKGDPIKIGTADRTPRETLEERPEKTPINARCFA